MGNGDLTPIVGKGERGSPDKKKKRRRNLDGRKREREQIHVM